MVITQKELKQRLYYDPETGVFTWLQHRWLDRVGERADSFEIDKGGFLWLDNKKHRTNRLAFLYMTGEIPVKVGFKDNNIENVRWDNLVVVTDNAAASYKAKRSRNNTSGYKGVSWSTQAKKWRAMCRHAGESIIFSAIMRQQKRLNWLMMLLLVACLGSFLIRVE